MYTPKEIPYHIEGELSVVRETSEQAVDEAVVEADEQISAAAKGKKKVGELSSIAAPTGPSSTFAPTSEPSPTIVGDEAEVKDATADLDTRRRHSGQRKASFSTIQPTPKIS